MKTRAIHQYLLILLCLTLVACASHQEAAQKSKVKNNSKPDAITQQSCNGEVVAPAVFAPMLTEVERPDLVTDSLGAADIGGLCQAKAYKVTQPFEIFRVWNSRTAESEFGHWWTFSMPSGKVAEYREKFAICPQYSPLDMMVRCTLKEENIVVLGTGQSAQCNDSLHYAATQAIQIYVANAKNATETCKSFYGVFSWQDRSKNPKTKLQPEQPSAADDSF